MLLPVLMPGPMFPRGGGLHSFRGLFPEGVSLQGVSPFRGGRQTHPSRTDILWNSSKRAVCILLEFNANSLTLDIYLFSKKVIAGSQKIIPLHLSGVSVPTFCYINQAFERQQILRASLPHERLEIFILPLTLCSVTGPPGALLFDRDQRSH